MIYKLPVEMSYLMRYNCLCNLLRQTEAITVEKLKLKSDLEAIARERLDHGETVNRLTSSLKVHQPISLFMSMYVNSEYTCMLLCIVFVRYICGNCRKGCCRFFYKNSYFMVVYGCDK